MKEYFGRFQEWLKEKIHETRDNEIIRGYENGPKMYIDLGDGPYRFVPPEVDEARERWWVRELSKSNF